MTTPSTVLGFSLLAAGSALTIGSLATCTSGGGGGGTDSAGTTSGATETSSGTGTGTATLTDTAGTSDTTGATDTASETGSTGGTQTGSGTGTLADPVSLGTAEDFVLLAKSGISTVPTSAITGDLGISPADATYITGFSLTVDASNEFSTAAQVTGRIFAADYAPPTPTMMTTAIGDMELAFTDAAGRAPDVTELGAGDIGGMTLEPGVYKWGTGLIIPTDVTLTGDATDIWILQIAQDLTVSSGAKVTLTGGAVPENVYWQVAGLVELGTTSHLEGIVLGQTAITLKTGASVNGRLLAQTSVDIDASVVVEPTP